MQQIQEFRHLMTHKEIDPVTFFVPTQLRFGLFEVVAVSVFFYEFVLNPPSGHRHRVWIWIWGEERGSLSFPNREIKWKNNKSDPNPNIHTFFVNAAEDDCTWVSVNDVQEEVSRIVVGLTGVSWEIKSPTKLHTSRLYQVVLYWIKVNFMLLPMSEKYSSALGAGAW